MGPLSVKLGFSIGSHPVMPGMGGRSTPCQPLCGCFAGTTKITLEYSSPRGRDREQGSNVLSGIRQNIAHTKHVLYSLGYISGSYT